jgi:hypothetical protein
VREELTAAAKAVKLLPIDEGFPEDVPAMFATTLAGHHEIIPHR